MIRVSRLRRFLVLILITFVILKIFFAGIFNQGINPVELEMVSKSNQVVDGSVKIVVFTPKQLTGHQMARTLKTVKKLNGESNENCRNRCEWTMNTSAISNADAVVFYFFYVGKDLPMEARNPGQIWAMHTREAPPYSGCKMDKLNGVFNWTINYRKDSDIWGPYGRKLLKKVESNKRTILIGNLPLDQWVTEKEQLVAQVVSRCQSRSKREVLVEKLQEAGLPIHIYGNCGKPLCGRYKENCTDFWNEIGRKYKFYLAFENSVCTDYITEKFWRSLELGMVPVVYGGGDYLDEAPPNSYIDVRSFSSAKELTQYLFKLDKEREEYKKFFKWRKDYTTVIGGGEWCKFCEALHEKNSLITKASKVYEDLDAWYWQRDPYSHHQTACQENLRFF